MEYINTFLKLKAEASGYPSWVRSLTDEDRYIQSFWDSEVIRQDKESIKYNAPKRWLEKLCLNSMWGKLTERNNTTQTKSISDPKELYRFLAKPCVEVTNLMFANDDTVWISWKFTAEELVPSLRHTKEVIGAYVTAGARIHLYQYLDRVREKVLYSDSDSMLYVQPRDEPELIETGDSLGAIISELKPGQYKAEFVSGGRKNYAYKVIDTKDGAERSKTVCKVRGITLNYTASQLVNFDFIRDMILNRESDHVVTVHTEHKIKRNRKLEGAVSIITEPEDKKYRISFLKTRRLKDNNSVPFGYV